MLTASSAGSARAIALLSLAAFASAASTRVCDGLLPQIAADFSVTPGQAASVITAYSATYGLLQIGYGLIADRFGKTQVVVLGTVTSFFTTVLCALAATLSGLTIARLLAGATAAGIIPLSLAWIGDTVPYERRQATIARFISGQIGGVVFGIAFGGVIGQALGWRAAFYLIAVLYVIATAGLVLQFRGALRARAPASAEPRSPFETLKTVLGRAWAQKVLITTFLEGFFCFGALAYVTATLNHRFGVGLAAAGLILSAFGLGGALYSLAAPRIVPRLGEAGGARVSSLFFVAAFLAFAWLPGAWLAAPASLAAGLAYYMLHNVLQVNATQMAPEARGAAMALFATAFFVGQSVGVAAAAPIVDRYGARPVFLLVAVLLPACALGFARAVDSKS